MRTEQNRRYLMFRAYDDDLEALSCVNVFVIPLSEVPVGLLKAEAERVRPLFTDRPAGSLVPARMGYQFCAGRWIEHEDSEELDELFGDGSYLITEREVADGKEVDINCGGMYLYFDAAGDASVDFEAFTDNIRVYTGCAIPVKLLCEAISDEIPANPQ